MKVKKQSTVAAGIICAVAVIFFIVILTLAFILPSSDSYSMARADYGMQFNYMNVDVKWNNDRTCHVKQSLEVEYLDNQPSHGIYVDIPVNSGERVRGLKVIATSEYRYAKIPYSLEHENGYNIVRVVVGDEDRTFSRGQTMQCVLEYDYITPKHPDGADILDINPIGYGWTSPIVSARVSVTFPSAPKSADGDYGVWVGGRKYSGKITVKDEGKTYIIETNNIEPFKGVRFKYLMPSGVLKSYLNLESILTIAIGGVLVVATVLLMLFVGRDKPLTPVVDYYPPRIDGMNGEKRHMLPVQMGKIIDGTCSNTDVTSLIFYWANKGYLAIEERDDGEIYLEKLKNVDAVTHYERTMFDNLFSKVKPDNDGKVIVSVSSLSGKFASTISSTKTAVNDEYSGKLYKTGFTVLSRFFTVLCAIYGLGFAVFSSLRIGSGFFNFGGIIVILPVLLSAGMGTILSRQYVKLSVNIRRMLLIALFAVTLIVSIGVMLIIPTDVMSWTEKALFALFLGVSSALSPFLTVRTDFYTEQLNNIIGFRNFLRDAEKDRLEMLLKDDPQYYYDILPYANVLGVSKIWADKFSGLTIEPPTYYHGYGYNMFDIYVMTRLTSSIGNSLSYVPPKSSSGSFSGGGHSSGGGGGFGGFGGGGGGRW